MPPDQGEIQESGGEPNRNPDHTLAIDRIEELIEERDQRDDDCHDCARYSEGIDERALHRRQFNPQQDCGEDTWPTLIDIGSQERPAGFGAWSHDGKWIVVAAWQRRASIWDTANGQCKGLVSDKRLETNPLDYMFSDVAASADGKRFALGAFSGKIHIFNARSSAQDGLSLEFEDSLNSIGGNPTPYSLAFNPRNPNELIAAYTEHPYGVVEN
jgi:WD40 repeat protein